MWGGENLRALVGNQAWQGCPTGIIYFQQIFSAELRLVKIQARREICPVIDLMFSPQPLGKSRKYIYHLVTADF